VRVAIAGSRTAARLLVRHPRRSHDCRSRRRRGRSGSAPPRTSPGRT
jgi:hypothetical protein